MKIAENILLVVVWFVGTYLIIHTEYFTLQAPASPCERVYTNPLPSYSDVDKSSTVASKWVEMCIESGKKVSWCNKEVLRLFYEPKQNKVMRG